MATISFWGHRNRNTKQAACAWRQDTLCIALSGEKNPFKQKQLSSVQVATWQGSLEIYIPSLMRNWGAEPMNSMGKPHWGGPVRKGEKTSIGTTAEANVEVSIQPESGKKGQSTDEEGSGLQQAVWASGRRSKCAGQTPSRTRDPAKESGSCQGSRMQDKRQTALQIPGFPVLPLHLLPARPQTKILMMLLR